jgi:IS5 family transposase
VLCAAGYNIKWLLRMIARKAVAFLQSVFLCLCELAGLSPKWSPMLRKWLDHALNRPASHLSLA